MEDDTEETIGKAVRDSVLIARVRNIRSKYAHLDVTLEDLHRERHEDKERKELLVISIQQPPIGSFVAKR